MKINHSFLATIVNSIKHNPFKSAASKIDNFITKIAGVKNSNDNLAAKPAFFKTFSVDYNTQLSQKRQTGYLSHFGQYQEPAIFIHGSGTHYIDGKGIQYYKGATVDDRKYSAEAAEDPYLSVKEFVAAVKRDFNLDLHRTGNTGMNPLHLICCYSGGLSPDSVAGQLSRELDRSVISYGENSPVLIFDEIIDKMDKHSRIYALSETYPNGVYKPLKQIIHLPNNQPGRIREIKNLE